MTVYVNFLLNLLIGVSIATASIPPSAPIDTSIVPEVPFYSQFSDIHAPEWQKLGCGIASLAMLIDFYHPGTVSVDTLLKEGIASRAFVNGAGWSHNGLALLANRHGLKGASYDFSNLDKNSAFAQFEEILKQGPAIASVHYTLNPKNPIPHLIVINSVNNGMVYFNDPAGKSAGGKISVQDFLKAWKKRFIVVRPV